MPISAYTITTSWTNAADGPLNVLIPAIDSFRWAVTAGAAPGVAIAHCPRRNRGEELSIELATGESLYVVADRPVETSVTTGA